MFHLNKEIEFGSQAGNVYEAMYNDFMRHYVHLVEDLLARKIYVMIYNGQNDLIVETPGTFSWAEKVHYDHADEFRYFSLLTFIETLSSKSGKSMESPQDTTSTLPTMNLGLLTTLDIWFPWIKEQPQDICSITSSKKLKNGKKNSRKSREKSRAETSEICDVSDLIIMNINLFIADFPSIYSLI